MGIVIRIGGVFLGMGLGSEGGCRRLWDGLIGKQYNGKFIMEESIRIE
jgi:hypothetical protein